MKRKTMAECWRLLMGVILACMALQGTHFCAGQTATPAKAASVEAAAGAASILGTYYFKGIGLLEIRQEGDLLVTELYGETESRAAIAAAVAAEIAGGTPQKPAAAFLSPQPHRGRLVGATRIEFADADSSPEAQRKMFGIMGPRISPEAPTQAMGLLATGAFGHYYERWELLPNNSLRVECAIPISNLTILAGDEVAKSAEFSDAFRTAATSPDTRAKFLDTYGAAHSGDLTRICGWKITNDSEREAWKALDGGDYARAAQLFQSAAQAEPTRPFACLGEAWARVGTKEFDLARKALQAGRGRLNDETRPWFMKFVFFVKDQIDSAETEAAGPEVDFLAISDVIGTSNPSVDLAVVNPQALKNKRASEWSAADLDLANKAVAAYPYWALIDKANGMRGRSAVQPVGQSAFSVQRMAAMKVPNFLSLQVAAKTVVLRGHVYRANRDYSNAVAQYALAVRLGQLTGHGTLIAHLIGIAMENIGLVAISQFFEDGLVADAQTFQVLSQAVDALDRNEVRLEPGEAFTYEGGAVPFTSDPATQATLEAIAVPNFLEAETRLQVVQTRLALVKAACAVKAKSLKPPFPATMDTAALAEDLFAPGQPLRYRAAGNEAVLYSLGPNKQDDGGALTYDPTNGTISAGDVILTIR